MELKVAMCQVNPTVGDLKGNLKIILEKIGLAYGDKVDVVVFPELVTTGYPPRDLLYREDIWINHDQVVKSISDFVHNLSEKITVIFGGLHQVTLTHGQYARYNAAYVVDNYSSRPRIIHKRLLPCYDVFDESRYFRPAETDEPYLPVMIKNRMGEAFSCDVLICEDIWNFDFTCDTPFLPASYTEDPVSKIKGSGPVFIINGSPFWQNKVKTCLELVQNISKTICRPIFYVNQIGAHDDIVTHGGSCFVNYDQVVMCNLFAEDYVEIELTNEFDKKFSPTGFDLKYTSQKALFELFEFRHQTWYGNKIDSHDFDVWCDYQALRLHIIDYCRRTGFKEVVLGLSGGIDSALVAAIACNALGGHNVHGVTMPSKFSSEGSWKDAEALAKNLRMGSFQNIPIGDIYQSLRKALLSGSKQQFYNSVTDENLQPRARANILMGLSNDHNWLLLTTGNKSELAVGYCTLYGDMSGGLAVISDIPKTRVYELARCINKYAGREIIPESTITKPPSAELAPNQLDTNSLPPYDVLDPLLEMIYAGMGIYEIARAMPQISASIIRSILDRVTKNEYKRQQTPIGPKVRERSFGSGRRMPIAAKLSFL